MNKLIVGAMGWIAIGGTSLVLMAGCDDAQALCEKAVAKMEECLPAMIDAQIKKQGGDLPEGAKEMLEGMKEKMKEGMKEAVADMKKECAEAKGKIASDAAQLKECLAKSDCDAFNECMEKAAK
jgi:hypothetical protein